MGPKSKQLVVPPQPQPGQILRMRYHDTAILQKGLDKIYGMDQYKMKVSTFMADILPSATIANTSSVPK